MHFGYGNGTYFTHPGIYNTVERINGVWYFDGTAYPEVALIWHPAVTAIWFIVFPIIFLVSISLLFIRHAKEKGVDLDDIVMYCVCFIIAAVLIGIALGLFYGG